MISMNAKRHQGALVLAPLLLFFLQACDSTPPEPRVEDEAPPTATDTPPPPVPEFEVPEIEIPPELETNRLIFEDCDPAEQAEGYADLVGEKISITFAWKEMDESTADLKAPATLLRIDSPSVVVNFDPRIPNREFYATAWIYSGHIEAQSDGSFAVDPCSAKIEKGGW